MKMTKEEMNNLKENTQEKQLMQVNENSIFYRIKNFFKNLFRKKDESNNYIINEQDIDYKKETEEQRNRFLEEIRKVEDDETRLLKLQMQYSNGEISPEELSNEQINSLRELYKKQIAKLKKFNAIRRRKIFEYIKKLETNN